MQQSQVLLFVFPFMLDTVSHFNVISCAVLSKHFRNFSGITLNCYSTYSDTQHTQRRCCYVF